MSTHAPMALEQNVAEAVAALARTLYPHVALPDSVYARVPAKLDEAAREDAAQAQTVNDGVADLDGRGGSPSPRARPSSSSPTPRPSPARTSSSWCARPPWSRSTPTRRRGSCSATRARPSRRAATSTAASTTSTGSPTPSRRRERCRASMTNDSDVVVGRRLRRRRRHAGQRALPGRREDVVLEAGAHHKPDDFIDDEWPSFGQLAWLDDAHDLRVVARGHGLPEPAGVDVQDGRRHLGALGRLLPALQGLGVPQPLRARRDRRHEHARLADRAGRRRALLRPGRGQARRHAHQRHPAAARQQQLQGDGQRRQARRLQGRQHRAAWRSTRAARRAAGHDPGRLQLPGRPARRRTGRR